MSRPASVLSVLLHYYLHAGWVRTLSSVEDEEETNGANVYASASIWDNFSQEMFLLSLDAEFGGGGRRRLRGTWLSGLPLLLTVGLQSLQSSATIRLEPPWTNVLRSGSRATSCKCTLPARCSHPVALHCPNPRTSGVSEMVGASFSSSRTRTNCSSLSCMGKLY